jgi:hypothetical protein
VPESPHGFGIRMRDTGYTSSLTLGVTLGRIFFNERLAALVARSWHVVGIHGLRAIHPQRVVEMIRAIGAIHFDCLRVDSFKISFVGDSRYRYWKITIGAPEQEQVNKAHRASNDFGRTRKGPDLKSVKDF